MLFVVFSILTFVYIGYCLYVNSRGSLEENLQLVLLIVGTCLVLVLVIILGRWVYLYLFVSVCSLVDVRPAERKASFEITLDNLSDSTQYLR